MNGIVPALAGFVPGHPSPPLTNLWWMHIAVLTTLRISLFFFLLLLFRRPTPFIPVFLLLRPQDVLSPDSANHKAEDDEPNKYQDARHDAANDLDRYIVEDARGGDGEGPARQRQRSAKYWISKGRWVSYAFTRALLGKMKEYQFMANRILTRENAKKWAPTLTKKNQSARLLGKLVITLQ